MQDSRDHQREAATNKGKAAEKNVEQAAQGETLSSHTGGVLNGGGEGNLPDLPQRPFITSDERHPDEAEQAEPGERARPQRSGSGGDGSGGDNTIDSDDSQGTSAVIRP